MSTAYLRFIFCVIHISMKEIAEQHLMRNWSAGIFATTAIFFANCRLPTVRKTKCCVGMKHRRRRKKIEEKAKVVAAV